jgi:hypothetical protein
MRRIGLAVAFEGEILRGETSDSTISRVHRLTRDDHQPLGGQPRWFRGGSKQNRTSACRCAGSLDLPAVPATLSARNN